MPDDPIKEYLAAITNNLDAGNATEHTHRPALQRLIGSLGEDLRATNEPKRVQCGAPDFIVLRGQAPLGYIEAKDIGADLDEVERSPQIARYLDGLRNLILTDYLEFRWYADGEHRLRARLAHVGPKEKLVPEKEGRNSFSQLAAAFLSASIATIGTPRELAARMAALARLIHDIIIRAFEQEDKGGSLLVQMEGFRKVLLHDLEPAPFADMYAQTIGYGLFAARCNHRGAGPFTREHAAFELPETNPFLIEMFDHIAGPRLDKRLTWAVDHLAELLNRADIEAILRDFGKRTRREDPVVHFYETFLAEYDPRIREARGVYYTPEPVVTYIVRSVDAILESDFGLAGGLADTATTPLYRTVQGKKGEPRREKTGECHKVLILDPAAGTGTFLYGVIDHIHEHVLSSGQGGTWPGYVSAHLLPRLFGFELLMAPYAVAHMKLGLQLAETGYDFRSGERLRIYLTNTLEEAHAVTGLDLFASMIAEEANAAGKIKAEAPVMVVLGNPPYSGHSENRGEWISNLLRGKDTLTNTVTANYFEVDGRPLGERNPKWLNDDYVKFIRFAQWRIERTGYGILGFISNHGYLDNPTFRGMRRSLMQTFDDIYIVDLHGNSKKKETAPDGSKDENVFDIQQGVAIGIFVKRAVGKKAAAAIRHAHLYGIREVWEKDPRGEPRLTRGKYRWLYDNDIGSTHWTKLRPQPPFYLFVPQDRNLLEEYERGWKLTDAMPINSVGIVTARDKLTIHWTRDELWKTIRDFVALPPEHARNRYDLGVDVRDWKVSLAQRDLRESGPRKGNIVPILYRPFDRRYTYYTGRSRGFICMPRPEVMRHMLAGENLGLIATRQTRDEWHVFSTTKIIGHKSLAAYDINTLFPLYLYPNGELPESLFDYENERRPNLASGFIDAFAKRLKMRFTPDGVGDMKKTLGPEDVFYYLYAVFHSPTYRSRYREFLKVDFPRVPVTSKAGLFRALRNLGCRLVELHLLENPVPLITKYRVQGDNRVEGVSYADGRVWINKTQCFEDVPREVWEFRIGGYQVCEKWLKDRKGHMLSYDDYRYYQQIVCALAGTIRIMAQIDAAIDRSGGWPLK